MHDHDEHVTWTEWPLPLSDEDFGAFRMGRTALRWIAGGDLIVTIHDLTLPPDVIDRVEVIERRALGSHWVMRCTLEHALPFIGRILVGSATCEQRDEVLVSLSENLDKMAMLRFVASLG
jgi:hypothetical protein